MPANWIRPSGYSSLRADDADVVARALAAYCRHASQPRLRDHVGVEQHDVVARIGGAQAAVDVGREARVLLALDDLDPVDRAQRGDVLGAAGVVGDDDPDHRRVGRPRIAVDERRPRRSASR